MFQVKIEADANKKTFSAFLVWEETVKTFPHCLLYLIVEILVFLMFRSFNNTNERIMLQEYYDRTNQQQENNFVLDALQESVITRNSKGLKFLNNPSFKLLY